MYLYLHSIYIKRIKNVPQKCMYLLQKTGYCWRNKEGDQIRKQYNRTSSLLLFLLINNQK